MAGLLPITARVVDPQWAQRVASPAHDSLSPSERRRYIEEHPHSYLTVTRSPEDLGPDTDGGKKHWTDAEALEASRDALERLRRLGAFSPADNERLFLYRLTDEFHSQVGVVGGLSVADYDRGHVRVHEQVKSSRAEHLANHLAVLRVQSSPIALAHPPDPVLREALADAEQRLEPLLDFTAADGLHQQVWAIDEPALLEMIREHLSRHRLYLVDGHHRAAAASAVLAGPETPGPKLMLCAVFSADELYNEAFHRCLDNIDVDRFIADLEARFAVRDAADIGAILRRGPDELVLRAARRWLLVTVPPAPAEGNAENPLDGLEPVRLQRQILGPILGIEASHPDDKLSYRHGIADRRDLEMLADAEEAAVWVMRPVPIAALMAVSDAGLVMPPKSTYFLPKVRSGVFLRSID